MRALLTNRLTRDGRFGRTPAEFVALCILVAASGAAPGQTPRVGMLKLPDGSAFTTTLYHLEVIGQLKTQSKFPYYILSGVGCQDCDANRSIYIHSPTDGPMKNEAEQSRFNYPGKETNYEDGSLVYEARTFFGDCLGGYPNSVIWFERWPGEDGLDSDIRVVQAKQDELSSQQMPEDRAKLAEVLAAVRKHKCREIPGLNRRSEP